MPWTFHGGGTSRDIYLRFRTGMSGTPMPSYKDTASDAEMWDLANFVVSLARKPVWSMSAQEIGARTTQVARPRRRKPTRSRAASIWSTPLHVRAVPLAGSIGFRRQDAAGEDVCRRPVDAHQPVRRLSDGESHVGQGDGARLVDRRGRSKRSVTTGVLRSGGRLPPFPYGLVRVLGDDARRSGRDDLPICARSPPIVNKVPAAYASPVLPRITCGAIQDARSSWRIRRPPLYPGNVGTYLEGRRTVKNASLNGHPASC